MGGRIALAAVMRMAMKGGGEFFFFKKKKISSRFLRLELFCYIRPALRGRRERDTGL